MHARTNLRVAMIAVLLALGAGAGSATEYTWKNNWNQWWNSAAQWNPAGGPPGAGDTARFTGTAYVNITDGDRADAVYSTGSGDITWTQTATLTIDTMLSYSNASLGRYRAILAGGGAVQVDNGELRFESAANSFNGGITINRGVLWGTTGGSLGNSAQTINLGSTQPGNDDATLRIGYNESFAQPIQVRAGNSGRATILNGGFYPQSTGAITLGKPLFLQNNSHQASSRHNTYGANYALRVDGKISGPFGVTITGIGHVQLGSAANDYVGDTTVSGGWLLLPATTSAVVGDFRVQHGLAMVRENGTLGALSNRLLLGNRGSFGGLGAWAASGDGIVTIADREFRLEGNGGILIGHGSWAGGSASWNRGKVSVDSVIRGSGRLLIGVDSTSYLNADNEYTGGTIVYDGVSEIYGSGNYSKNVYGSGDVVIDRLGTLVLRDANNIAATANVLVRGTLALATDYVPTLDPNSSGTISLYQDSVANINARLATTAAQLGNGKMVLAGYNKLFTGSSLQAGIDGIYRLRGANSGAGLYLTAGCLGGANSLQSLLGTVGLRAANTYSGETRVASGTLEGTAQAAGSPFGSATGPVWIGASSTWRLLGANSGVPVKKGPLTYEGIGIVQVDKTATGYSTELEVDSLVRSSKAVLAIQGVRTDLGGNERFKVTTGAPAPHGVNGMVAPYYVDYGGYFLTYGANGFARVTTAQTSFTGANADSVVYLSGTEGPADIEVYALRTGVNVTGGNTVTLGSGGLILAGGTHTAKFSFPVEGTVFCSADSVLNGAVTAGNGFIKSGSGALTLGADNTTLAGVITVNQGDVRVGADNQLGTATVTLNGGALKTTATLAVDNNIELGLRGGSLGATAGTPTFSGNITGPGSLSIPSGTISGTANDYSGGTYVGSSAVTVAANSRLGTGPVSLSYIGTLVLLGNANLPPDQPVSMGWPMCVIYFQSAFPVCGTISGDGDVLLGKSGAATALTVGRDNGDGDFYGWIVEDWRAPANSGKVIKDGTGTWTLWGENTYGGGTVVTGGTLVVNNWLNPVGGVVVHDGATLDGIGTVGLVDVRRGGTVKGNLVTAGLTWGEGAVLQVALNGVSDYDVVTANGPVALNGALSIDLNFVPAIGQEFTIIANDGTDPVTGAFDADTVNVTYNGAVVRFQVVINGGDGNDVVLVRIPTGTMIMVK